MKLVVRRGLEVQLPGSPIQQVMAANAVRAIGLLGTDSPEIRAELLVSEGEQVAVGTPLYRDRKRPALCFTAPVAGTVSGISYGDKRYFTGLMIAVGGDERKQFDISRQQDPTRLRVLLLDSGLWPSFITRPFGRIPDPDSAPDAIFVTAMDTQPLAADARVVLAGGEDDFARGVSSLALLTDGPVFVCQQAGPQWVRDDERVKCVEVAGPHPAGLAATHVNRLFPLGGRRTVWQINYQDVMAIGALLRSGELPGERVISLAGPGIRKPRLVRVALGADLDDLVEGELTEGPKQIVAGPVLAGRAGRFLGRHQWQVTALPRPKVPPWRGWFSRHARRLKPQAIVATAALERSLALDIPLLPLLRALSVGDTETALGLGCLELLEEDMALVDYATGGTQDFAALLRATLDRLESNR